MVEATETGGDSLRAPAAATDRETVPTGAPDSDSGATGIPKTRRNRGPIHLTLLILVLCVFAANALRWSQAGEDPDFWWHLRTGNWILQHDSVPVTDSYAWTTAGKPWIAYHWLFDVLLAKLFAVRGLKGISLLIALLSLSNMSVLTALLARYTNVMRALVLAGTVQIAVFSLRAPRPWLFTILFFSIELWLLLEACEKRRPVFLIAVVPLLALWSNLHVQFIYGLGLAGLFALQQSIPPRSKWSFAADTAGKKLPAIWLWGLLGTSSLATLVNPYGWRVWNVVVQDMTERVSLAIVQDSQALQFRDFTCWAALLLICSAWFALGRMKKRPVFLLLLLVVSCWFGFRAQREIWFPVTAAALIIAYSSRQSDEQRQPLARISWVFAFAAALLFTISETSSAGRTRTELEKAVAEHYPVAASAFIESHGLQGPLYNPYTWGGYLIWRLPHLRVSMDGRSNLHGDERVLRSARTNFAGKDWTGDKELFKAKTIVLEDDSPLAAVLRSDLRFRLVYRDKVASVFQPAD